MTRLSVGTATIPTPENEQKPETKELTILAKDSKDSLYSLIFKEEEKGELEKP